MKRLFWTAVTALAVILTLLPSSGAQAKHRFDTDGDHFALDGKPFQVISGEMHYARIPREYWRARLRMARAMGLNTVATYIFWNVHEPRPGVYDFSGNNDVAAFIRMAHEEHLYVLLRTGPYSCAEWEFGGFPAWLLKDPKMSTALRSKDPAFMVPVDKWMHRLAKELKGLHIDEGGPILATQVENEYGNFSNDHTYMQAMRDLFLRAGFTQSMLFTVDPSKALANGNIPGVYSGVNFGGGRAQDALTILAKLRPGQPLFATEYWPGWFDLWGHPHETRDLAPQLADLNYTLSHGASINIYMVHGGSSFGPMPGASQSTGAYRGNTQSYDYGAPIDEAGHPTKKFFAYRDIILKYTHAKALPVPETTPVIEVPPFSLTRGSSLWSNLPRPTRNDAPLTMEQLDQAYGYVLYRKQLTAPVHGTLHLDHLYDYAQIFLDGKQVGTLDRHYHQEDIALDTSAAARLDILVENTGRLNSTKWMRDERKGFRAAAIDGVPLKHWEMYALPMDEAPRPGAGPKTGTASENGIASTAGGGPHFATGHFHLDATGDTYLDVRALGKGMLWINGHALGRFWNIGPQETMYVPAPWLRKGRNDVAIFELNGSATTPMLRGLREPILDGPTPTYADDPERKGKQNDATEFGKRLQTPADAPAQP